MEAKQYTISEAAKKLHVGSHVLRFWEEELHLNIPRNEMGHRVYSEKEMKQLAFTALQRQPRSYAAPRPQRPRPRG